MSILEKIEAKKKNLQGENDENCRNYFKITLGNMFCSFIKENIK
jgi:hypothetical protein